MPEYTVPPETLEEAMGAGLGGCVTVKVSGLNQIDRVIADRSVKSAAPIISAAAFEAGRQVGVEEARDRAEAVHHHEGHVTEAPGPLSRAQVWAAAVDACVGAIDGDEQWEAPSSAGSVNREGGNA